MTSLLNKLLPVPLAEYLRSKKRALRFGGDDPKAAFSTIYRTGLWNTDEADDYCSGSGSHAPEIVQPYVSAVTEFLRAMPRKPSVVDLGCGDFNVGRQIRPLCDQYVAADVVPELIEKNARVFDRLSVDFRVIDMTTDELPKGDVVFIRQVLQHLSNRQIGMVVPKLYAFRYAVITEELPSTVAFKPNIDKPMGWDVRVGRPGIEDSGVVLTEPPFCLRVKSQRVLCEIPEKSGIIRTIAFEMDVPEA